MEAADGSVRRQSAADGDAAYEIRGTVAGPEGDPPREVRVVVWWQHIREREEIAADETSEEGRYILRYRVPEHAPSPMLLIVEAESDGYEERISSPSTEAAPVPDRRVCPAGVSVVGASSSASRSAVNAETVVHGCEPVDELDVDGEERCGLRVTGGDQQVRRAAAQRLAPPVPSGASSRPG
jgi:hypothetical protein